MLTSRLRIVSIPVISLNDNRVALGDDDIDDDFYEDEEQIAPPDMRFRDELISQVGGMGRIATGNVPMNFLEQFAAGGWSLLEKLTPHPYLPEQCQERPSNAMAQTYPYHKLWTYISCSKSRRYANRGFFFLCSARFVGKYCRVK
ncbi:unnamed protein product [Phytophthora fragariaefolia]|uniref:Unnamed protein product n=1 Tax=Phytophthora fragariaefolia TaxID=1490495 RepID=A0A9W6XC13_9STRA|nr:unnamed protein product [Phytophthora fragariaefolia]